MHAVEILWVDSASTRGWRRREGASAESGTSQCRSVGYLLTRDSTTVKIVQSRTAEKDAYENVAEILSIPTRCITKIRRLR